MPTNCRSVGQLDASAKTMRSFRNAVKFSIQQGVEFKKTRTFSNTAERTQTFTEETIFSEIFMSEQRIGDGGIIKYAIILRHCSLIDKNRI